MTKTRATRNKSIKRLLPFGASFSALSLIALSLGGVVGTSTQALGANCGENKIIMTACTFEAGTDNSHLTITHASPTAEAITTTSGDFASEWIGDITLAVTEALLAPQLSNTSYIDVNIQSTSHTLEGTFTLTNTSTHSYLSFTATNISSDNYGLLNMRASDLSFTNNDNMKASLAAVGTNDNKASFIQLDSQLLRFNNAGQIEATMAGINPNANYQAVSLIIEPKAQNPIFTNSSGYIKLLNNNAKGTGSALGALIKKPSGTTNGLDINNGAIIQGTTHAIDISFDVNPSEVWGKAEINNGSNITSGTIKTTLSTDPAIYAHLSTSSTDPQHSYLVVNNEDGSVISANSAADGTAIKFDFTAASSDSNFNEIILSAGSSTTGSLIGSGDVAAIGMANTTDVLTIYTGNGAKTPTTTLNAQYIQGFNKLHITNADSKNLKDFQYASGVDSDHGHHTANTLLIDQNSQLILQPNGKIDITNSIDIGNSDNTTGILDASQGTLIIGGAINLHGDSTLTIGVNALHTFTQNDNIIGSDSTANGTFTLSSDIAENHRGAVTLNHMIYGLKAMTIKGGGYVTYNANSDNKPTAGSLTIDGNTTLQATGGTTALDITGDITLGNANGFGTLIADAEAAITFEGNVILYDNSVFELNTNAISHGQNTIIEGSSANYGTFTFGANADYSGEKMVLQDLLKVNIKSGKTFGYSGAETANHTLTQTLAVYDSSTFQLNSGGIATIGGNLDLGTDAPSSSGTFEAQSGSTLSVLGDVNLYNNSAFSVTVIPDHPFTQNGNIQGNTAGGNGTFTLSSTIAKGEDGAVTLAHVIQKLSTITIDGGGYITYSASPIDNNHTTSTLTIQGGSTLDLLDSSKLTTSSSITLGNESTSGILLAKSGSNLTIEGGVTLYGGSSLVLDNGSSFSITGPIEGDQAGHGSVTISKTVSLNQKIQNLNALNFTGGIITYEATKDQSNATTNTLDVNGTAVVNVTGNLKVSGTTSLGTNNTSIGTLKLLKTASVSLKDIVFNQDAENHSSALTITTPSSLELLGDIKGSSVGVGDFTLTYASPITLSHTIENLASLIINKSTNATYSAAPSDRTKGFSTATLKVDESAKLTVNADGVLRVSGDINLGSTSASSTLEAEESSTLYAGGNIIFNNNSSQLTIGTTNFTLGSASNIQSTSASDSYGTLSIGANTTLSSTQRISNLNTLEITTGSTLTYAAPLNSARNPSVEILKIDNAKLSLQQGSDFVVHTNARLTNNAEIDMQGNAKMTGNISDDNTGRISVTTTDNNTATLIGAVQNLDTITVSGSGTLDYQANGSGTNWYSTKTFNMSGGSVLKLDDTTSEFKVNDVATITNSTINSIGGGGGARFSAGTLSLEGNSELHISSPNITNVSVSVGTLSMQKGSSISGTGMLSIQNNSSFNGMLKPEINDTQHTLAISIATNATLTADTLASFTTSIDNNSVGTLELTKGTLDLSRMLTKNFQFGLTSAYIKNVLHEDQDKTFEFIKVDAGATLKLASKFDDVVADALLYQVSVAQTKNGSNLQGTVHIKNHGKLASVSGFSANDKAVGAFLDALPTSQKRSNANASTPIPLTLAGIHESVVQSQNIAEAEAVLDQIQPQVYADGAQEISNASSRFATRMMEVTSAELSTSDYQWRALISPIFNYTMRGSHDGQFSTKSIDAGVNIAALKRLTEAFVVGGSFQFDHLKVDVDGVSQSMESENINIGGFVGFKKQGIIPSRPQDHLYVKGSFAYTAGIGSVNRQETIANYANMSNPFLPTKHTSKPMTNVIRLTAQSTYGFNMLTGLEVGPYARLDIGWMGQGASDEDGSAETVFHIASSSHVIADLTLGGEVHWSLKGTHSMASILNSDFEGEILDDIIVDANMGWNGALTSKSREVEYGIGSHKDTITIDGLDAPGIAGAVWGVGVRAKFTKQTFSLRYDGSFSAPGNQINNAVSLTVGMSF